MEWDMPAWDLGELERRDEAAAASARGPDCSVDLQLGGGFGRADSARDQQQPRQGAARSSAKRARAAGSGQSAAACMVDGCRSDLSKCKEYHRRHRVCEAHSKTPVVLVGGQQQRFCQQCSRFHSLMEFDEVKRSCRKRLDGHNRRRRKVQPEAASHSRFLPGWNMYHPGSRLPQTPPVFSTAAQRFDWTAEASNQDGILYRHSTEPHFMGRQQFGPFFPGGFREGKPFPFLQGASGGMAMDTPPSLHQLVPNFSLENNSKVSADCALSLLSSTAQTSGIALRHMMHNPSVPVALPLHRSPQEYNVMCGLSHPVTGDDRGNATATVSGNAGVQSHGCFHGGGEGSQSGHSHALPFSWQ